MTKFLLIPVLAIIMVFSSFIPAGDSEKYTSAEGHFSIVFPGKPEESTQDDETDDNVFYKIHTATYAPSESEAYIIGWADLTKIFPKNKTVKQFLEDCRDNVTRSMRALQVTTTATEIGDKSYIEFTFASDEATGKDRIYLINKFQYSIITIFSLKTGISPSADKFITSFTPI